MIKSFEELFKSIKGREKRVLAVAKGEDPNILEAIEVARQMGAVDAILVGSEEEILKIMREKNIDESLYEIRDIASEVEAAEKAVELVRSGEAHILVKGLIETSTLLKALLNREKGLRTDSILSHIAVYEVETYHKLLILTDAAMNIAPDLKQKEALINNAVALAHRIGIEKPKVACMCAKEKVNAKMVHTQEAAELTEKNRAGEIKGCIVDGPLALDNIVNKEAARHKGIDSEVAGDADVILCPNIESANALFKALTFLCGSRSAGVLVGAKAPVVLVSRADSDDAKLNSILLASFL